MNKKILSFSREIVIVLIGVIIALIINDWKEENNNRKYINSVLTAVNADINVSHSSLEEVLEKHHTIIDSFEVNLENENESIRTIVEQIGGVQYPEIKNTSLSYLVSNKAELIDYELISLTADIEASTIFLEKKFDKLMDFAYDKMEEKDEKSKMMFAIHLVNVIDSEMRLLKLYKDFLEKQSTYEQD